MKRPDPVSDEVHRRSGVAILRFPRLIAPLRHHMPADGGQRVGDDFTDRRQIAFPKRGPRDKGPVDRSGARAAIGSRTSQSSQSVFAELGKTTTARKFGRSAAESQRSAHRLPAACATSPSVEPGSPYWRVSQPFPCRSENPGGLSTQQVQTTVVAPMAQHFARRAIQPGSKVSNEFIAAVVGRAAICLSE